jgi:hypothetical protein
VQSSLTHQDKVITTPEINLLLCCARTHLEPEMAAYFNALIIQDLDWTYFAQLAMQQGIVPLVNKNLQLAKPKTIPQQILDYFKKYSYQIAIQNTVFAKELYKIVALLQSHEIPVISFKGPALATSAYGNLGLRQFCDLDILINPKKSLASFDVLVAQGYVPTHKWDFLNQDFETSLRCSKSEYSLANGTVCIDLHQHLTVERFLSSQFSFDDLWNRRQTISICGYQVDGFSNEDLLLYLCIHGSKDCWQNLKLICDVSEFIYSHAALDWAAVLQRAEEMNCLKMLLIGLFLSKSVLNVTLPDIIEEKIKENEFAQNLATEFSEKIFVRDDKLGRQFTMKKFFVHLKLTETFKDKVGCYLDLFRPIQAYFLLKLIPTTKDRDFLEVPQSLYFLYYLIRPIRLIWTQIAAAP